MILIIFLLFHVLLACNEIEIQHPDQENVYEITLMPETTYQTIHNFGASDAWSSQFVGNWPDKQKNRIADLLFSMETQEDGSPKGIGLTAWRFNIGAGSARQGSNSGIDNTWQRTESFLQDERYRRVFRNY